MLNKRGQITAFIIIAILIAATIIIIYFLKDYIFKSEWEREKEKAFVVPPQAEKIRDYVISCIEDKAEEGINIMAMQGGYIELPKDELGITGANIFSNNLLISEYSDMRVPYWYYISANNIEKTQIPSLEFMEKQLGEYVNNNLLDCINNFNIFIHEGYDIKFEKIKTSAEITNKNVLLNVEFPVLAQLKDFQFKFNSFYGQLDTNFGELYEVAKKIFENENKNFFLEEKTIDMLVLYDNIPYSGTDFSCDVKVWSKLNVLNELKKVIAVNIPYIRIKGTEYTEREKYFEWDVLGKNYDSVFVNFIYLPSWPIKMEVEPSEGDILRSDQFIKKTGGKVMQFLSGFFCLTDYNFVYDIKYPILINLNKGNDIFQFATQVIVDNNQPRKNREIINLMEAKNDICEQKLTELTVNALKINSDESLIPVSDAKISFKCINSVCDIGYTNVNGELTAKFPQCIKGLVIAEKDELQEGNVVVDSLEEGSVSVLMEPYYRKNFEIKILDSNKIRAPSSNEKVLFYLENQENGYSTSVYYPSNQTYIELIPGVYNVKAYVMEDGNEIEISGKKIEKCVDVPRRTISGFFGAKDKKCIEVELPSVNVKEIVKGGSEFSWSVNRAELANANSVLFYTEVEKLPTNYDELTKIYEKIEENEGKIVLK